MQKDFINALAPLWGTHLDFSNFEAVVYSVVAVVVCFVVAMFFLHLMATIVKYHQGCPTMLGRLLPNL